MAAAGAVWPLPVVHQTMLHMQLTIIESIEAHWAVVVVHQNDFLWTLAASCGTEAHA
jgi:hypothetical protein